MKRINEAAFLKPWAMKEDVVVAMRDIVIRHLKGEDLTQMEIAARTDGKKEPPAYEVIDGTARVPIYGMISKRASLLQKISCPGTSVMEINDMLRMAVEDPQVKRIVLDIDSPGGSTDGVSELSDYIFSLRGQKEITAFANGQMCSAAYWIGSAASQVYASSGAVVGSIGVYAVVDDYTHANWEKGIKTEVVKAGRNKAAGHPDKAFTQEDRAVIQGEVNMFYDLFVKAVARNRGITVEDAIEVATGDIFIGAAAKDEGLVDGIMAFDAVLKSPAADAGQKTKAMATATDTGIDENNKTTQTTQTEEVAMELKDITIDQLKAGNKAVADALYAEGKAAGIAEGKAAGVVEGKAAGVAEGKAAEQKRIADITMAAPKGMDMIAFAAIKDGKTVEEAKDGFLKSLKAEAPIPPGQNGEEASGKKSHLAAAQEYQKEHKCTIAEALSATASPRHTAR